MITLYSKDGNKVLDIEVDDSSYTYRELMGDTRLMLYFALADYIEIPTGSWCNIEGNRYEAIFPSAVKIQHRRNYEYTLEMRSDDSLLSYYKFREITYAQGVYGGSRRLKFSLTATPREHLEMVVANLNERTDGGWTIGECIDSSEKVVTYSHVSVLDALKSIAETFDTEYEITSKTISLRKVEYYKDSPLSLAYGRGDGLKSGLERTNRDEQSAIGVLFVEGSDQNIDPTMYDGAKELHLPKGQSIAYDGEHFEGETDFDSSKQRTYTADENGWSLSRTNPPQTGGVEESIDLTDIYPTKEHTVSKVIVADASKNFYDIVLDPESCPESLNYRDCSIKGETAYVVFQDKMLAGKQFDIQTDTNGRLYCEKYLENGVFAGWKINLVPQEIDGVMMPGGVWVPVEGQKLKVFGVQLPQAYIADNTTKTGAEWELFKKAVKYMYDNEEQNYTLKAEVDGIWAKKNWSTVSPYMRVGAYVRFSDPSVQTDGKLIRVTGIKQYINNPHSPEVTLSTNASRPSITSALKQINNSEYETEEYYRRSLAYSRRRFRDAKETAQMLVDAKLTGFTDEIKPIAVQTMQTLVGDESLQFRWVTSYSDLTKKPWNVVYSDGTLTCPSGYLQHMTIGVDDAEVVAARSAEDYMIWLVSEHVFSASEITDASKGYYLYARVSKTLRTGDFVISPIAIAMNSEEGYYHLLVGILNSESNGTRAFSPMYGYTEVLPSGIQTTGVIASDTLLAEEAHIGDWVHKGGKLYSKDDAIVLDALSKLIQIGRRLNLTPNELYFLNEELTKKTLQVSGDAVGEWEAIPFPINVSGAAWTDKRPVEIVVEAGQESKSEAVSVGVTLGNIKSGSVKVRKGTILSMKVPEAYIYYSDHEDPVQTGVTVNGKVRIMSGSTTLASVSLPSGGASGGETYTCSLPSDLSATISSSGVVRIAIDMTFIVRTGVFSEDAHWYSYPVFSLTYDAVSQGEERTYIAPDGFKSVWGEGYLLFNKDMFIVRKGTHLLRITSNGNEYSNDGGETWKEIGSGTSDSTGGGTSVTVDSALSSTSSNPVRNSTIYAALQGKMDAVTLAAVATSGKYSDLSGKPAIPQSLSDLTNDMGFLTEHQSLADYAKRTELPTKTSQLTNDSGFLTQHQSLSGYVLKSHVATINGQSLTEGGNIVIESGGGGGSVSVMSKSAYDGLASGGLIDEMKLYAVSALAPIVPNGMKMANGLHTTSTTSTTFDSPVNVVNITLSVDDIASVRSAGGIRLTDTVSIDYEDGAWSMFGTPLNNVSSFESMLADTSDMGGVNVNIQDQSYELENPVSGYIYFSSSITAGGDIPGIIPSGQSGLRARDIYVNGASVTLYGNASGNGIIVSGAGEKVGTIADMATDGLSGEVQSATMYLGTKPLGGDTSGIASQIDSINGEEI